MKTLIIIPAYNEADTIESVVDSVITLFPQYDYIVFNDDRTDGTSTICRRRGYNHINSPINMGIGGAVQVGYQYALENGYEIAVNMTVMVSTKPAVSVK